MQKYTATPSLQTIIIGWFFAFAISLEAGIFFAQVFAAIGGLIALYTIKKHLIPIPKIHPAIYPLAAVFILQLISALFSDDPSRSTSMIFRYYALPFTGLLAVQHLCRNKKILKSGFSALLIAGVIGGLYGIFQTFSGIDPVYGQRLNPIKEIADLQMYGATGFREMKMVYAAIQMMIFLFCIPIVWKSKGKQAVLRWIALIIILLSVVLLLKRSPWMGIGAGLFVFFLARSWKTALGFILSGIVIVSLLAIFSNDFRDQVDKTIHFKTNRETDRLYYWNAAWEMGKDHLLLGVGPGNWGRHVDDYLPERDWWSKSSAHSDPMQIWATTGLPGFIAWYSVLFLLFLQGIRDLKKWTEKTFFRDIYLGALISLAGFAVFSLTQCHLGDGKNGLTVGLILGLGLAARGILAENSVIRESDK
ncbi:MAG: O-antigen ligase family protein [Candidatus Electryonea clarkiae]|nr:O-antigen ligase family protein [Candidatus Electryonea clarkiae]MDP8286159.1 O-antigen ligase family protein [Candidatus Electryonea clarkiae]